MTAESIDFLLPKHERADCNDKELQNGLGSAEFGGAKCRRCVFLSALKSGEWPEYMRIEVVLHNSRGKLARRYIGDI
jgi:hypothetical protein